MKMRIISMLVAICIAVGITFFLVRPRPPHDSSDIVDLLVDAGIEFSASPIDADLIKYRKLVIATDINAVISQRIIKGLLLLNAMDSAAPIDLYIRTEGGWISDAFGIIDVMESISAPVNTHAIGGTHSCGAMILAAGTGVRYAYTYSSIMFHSGFREGDGSDNGDKIDNERLTHFWERHSRVPAEWVTSEEEKIYYLSPEEALKYGLIDQIKADDAGTDPGVGK